MSGADPGTRCARFVHTVTSEPLVHTVTLERGRECLFELATFDPSTADVRDLIGAAQALRDANRAFVRAMRERVEQMSKPRGRTARFSSHAEAARFLWPEHLPQPSREQLDVTLLNEIRYGRARREGEPILTERQLEVLRAAHAGEHATVTARRLGVGRNNVDNIRRRIRHRLVGVYGTTFEDAIREAVRLGLLPDEKPLQMRGRARPRSAVTA